VISCRPNHDLKLRWMIFGNREREETAARKARWYQTNKERCDAKARVWCEANKDKIAAKGKVYYEANKEKLAAKRKANKDKAYEADRDR